MALLSFPYGLPWGISRDVPPPPSESVRRYVRTYGSSYADVIIKFSRLDGLPIFLTHGASLTRFARWSSAINYCTIALSRCEISDDAVVSLEVRLGNAHEWYEKETRITLLAAAFFLFSVSIHAFLRFVIGAFFLLILLIDILSGFFV